MDVGKKEERVKMTALSNKIIIESMNEDEHALIIDSKGNFKGILAPYQLNDFDQLPKTILDILTLLYGDQVNYTRHRTIH